MTDLAPRFWADLIGLPFRPLARGPEAYDCWGVFLEIFRRRGIVIPDWTYPDDEGAHADALLAGLARGGWRETEVSPGVGLLFRSRQSLLPQHVGVAIDGDRFVHATVDRGQVCIERLSRGFRPFLLKAYEPI
jgi:cell wall-associated NlpC family hydrolase